MAKKTTSDVPRCHDCPECSAPPQGPQRGRSPVIDLLALVAILSVPVVLFLLDKANASAIAAASEFVAAVLLAWKR